MAQVQPLRMSPIPGVALGGLIGGIAITNVVTRLSQRNERTSLFVRRRAKRRCPRCSGFGITRCDLCKGEAMLVSSTLSSIIFFPNLVIMLPYRVTLKSMA